MRFSQQEYWSGLPCPPPGDLRNPGIEPRSPTLQADALTSAPPGKPLENKTENKSKLGCLVAPHSSTLARKNPMNGGAWWAAVHGAATSWIRLSNFTFTFHFHALEKEMATHSSVLAWRIPGTGKPGRLPSMGSHRVRHD